MKKIFLILLYSCAASNLLAQTWAELGAGNNALKANNTITSIVIDKSDNVYAAGSFTNAAGYYIVSKWNGVSWNELGNMANNINKGNTIPTQMNCLAIDSIDNVYVTYAGSATPKMFMKWNGTSWTVIAPSTAAGVLGPLAVDKSQDIFANMFIEDFDANVSFYVVAEYPGWSVPGATVLSGYGANSQNVSFYRLPSAITIDPLGNVYVAKSSVVKWDRTVWSTLGNGQENLDLIQDLAADQAGNIYAASNSSSKNYVAVWDGTSWAELGMGINALKANGDIWTLSVDKFGNVYAAGDFTNADGLRYVAKWDGSSWTELGAGTGALAANGIIYDVTTDGVGNVYAAGDFTNAHGKKYVAKWSADETLGIRSRASAQVEQFYPNPSNGFSCIKVIEDVELTVYSSLGEPLKTMYIHSGSSSIDLSFLTEGLYMLVCRGKTDTNYTPIKFIKE
ncbi:T9SS type A sorting domain-containing protein [Cytophaga aurantiaca]|uniref:T9SS type A sorting domain-containing protein n=1 Tax=Cytophaga aurantiaca TaxID=29530 RepID=UPI00037BA4CE|nr:T9SS type A sorting domain-containing protein [Cytophaga aurantiaca]